MAWKKLKCIIELPVNGDASEKDLVWAVKLSLSEIKVQQRMLLGKDVRTGRLLVKQFNKVMVKQ